jgi:hypothetical protein
MSYILDAGNENSKVVHITSTDATQELDNTGAYLKYDLEQPLLCPPNQDTLVSLYSAVIPYSFYNIRKDVNDRVSFYNTNSAPLQPGGPSWRFFQITPGSYTINSLKNFLTTMFNNQTGNYLTSGNTTIEFDRVTMKFVFKQTNREWYFDSQDPTDLPRFLAHTSLGLPNNYNENINSFVLNSVSGKYEYTTPFVPDVNGSTHSVNIRTNLASKGCIDSQSKSFSTILGTIPIDVNFGGVIFFRPADAIHKVVITSKDIKNIVIRLTDDRDRLLDLNGLAFNVTILIDHIKHGRDMRRRIGPVARPLQSQQPKRRGRPRKEDKSERTKKDIPIPLIN